MPVTEIRRNIVDGFMYDLFLRPSTEQFYPMALAQMEIWRRAAAYRPRWHTIPDADDVANIPAYQTVEEQARIVPGSWIWGASLSCLDPATLLPVDPSTRIAIKMMEGGSGVYFTWDYCSGYTYWTKRPYPGALAAANFPHRPCLLSQPRLVLEPGYVNVEMANISTGNLVKCQIVLYVMEPCLVLQEDYTECWPERARTA